MGNWFVVIFFCFPLVGLSQELKDTTCLNVGDRCPEFIYEDILGRKVSFQQFRGKYVVIDVWASWCYPCKQEYPRLKYWAEKFRDKNIVFVSLSCDTQEFRWRNELCWGKMVGYQWWIAGNESSMIAFRITSVPRFILLDKKGRIMNLNLPKPSDPEFERILKNLKGV